MVYECRTFYPTSGLRQSNLKSGQGNLRVGVGNFSTFLPLDLVIVIPRVIETWQADKI